MAGFNSMDCRGFCRKYIAIVPQISVNAPLLFPAAAQGTKALHLCYEGATL
jgi:hypothetical protein